MCLTTLFWLAFIGAFLLGLLVGWWIWSKYKSLVAEAERQRDQAHDKYDRLSKEHKNCLSEINNWKSKHNEAAKLNNQSKDNGSQWKSKYESLEREHSGCAAKITAAGVSSAGAGMGAAGLASSFAGNNNSNKNANNHKPSAPKPSGKPDDLKKVEGIGPKIAEILNKNGVTTWAQLADTDPTKIKTWLEAAGPRYKMHKPGSWPKQARMAADGKWDELEKWQDAHKGGVE